MGEDEKLLRKIAESLKAFIVTEQKARGITASGRSAQSLRVESSPVSAELYGLHYFLQQEKGRGPTQNPEANTPTLRERILAWIDEKGIKPFDIKKESLAFIISRKIHEEGTRLHRKISGSESNSAQPVGIEEGINNVIRKFKPELQKQTVVSLTSDIIKGIKLK